MERETQRRADREIRWREGLNTNMHRCTISKCRDISCLHFPEQQTNPSLSRGRTNEYTHSCAEEGLMKLQESSFCEPNHFVENINMNVSDVHVIVHTV